MSKLSWIAVDWGTTQLRAWAMDSEDQVIANTSSDRGMGRLTPPEFESALLELVEPWLEASTPVLVVACGMVGARQGWHEAPYADVKDAFDPQITWVDTTDQRLHVCILPGVRQLVPADVMRGEETQITGVLALEPKFNGMLCLPGTHTKWAEVREGTLRGFKTYMTGEIFGLLSSASVLSHSVNGSAMDQTAFIESVLTVAKHPESLAGSLFSIRSMDLLHGASPAVARARLSGSLIGAELASVTSNTALESETLIIGTDQLAKLYAAGLRALDKPARMLNADDCTLAGLKRAKVGLTLDVQ